MRGGILSRISVGGAVGALLAMVDEQHGILKARFRHAYAPNGVWQSEHRELRGEDGGEDIEEN